MPTSSPPVRVVVLNWNSYWFTRRCVTALLATSMPAGQVEIVVVDNASVDGSLERLRRDFPAVRFVENSENLGFAEACNRGMRDLGRQRYVALINNDTMPEPGWLAPLVAALESDRSAGAAAAALVLEPGFARVDLEHLSGDIVLESVRVGAVDVLDRTLATGLRAEGRVDWPMDLVQHLDGDAELLVPAGPAPAVARLVFRGAGAVRVSSSGTSVEVIVAIGSEGVVDVDLGADRKLRLNGLGTELTDDCEGVDRGFGDAVDLAGRSIERVPGFCGGAVLLRGEALDEVGLFDPAFFAYYEDTDLSWRLRRAGWHTVAVPDSVVHHAFGGSAGAKAAGFFFLNYRNWMMTVLRNADRRQRRVAAESAWRRIRWAIRANVLSPLRHRRRPDLKLLSAWAGVLLAGFLALPRLRSDTAPGRRATERVRSRLQPMPTPRAPASRPGGPLLVYVEVGVSPMPGAPWSDFAVALAEDPRVDVVALVPVRSAASATGFRRCSRDEWSRMLGGHGASGPVDATLDLAWFDAGAVRIGPGQTAAERSIVLDEPPVAVTDLVDEMLERFGRP